MQPKPLQQDHIIPILIVIKNAQKLALGMKTVQRTNGLMLLNSAIFSLKLLLYYPNINKEADAGQQTQLLKLNLRKNQEHVRLKYQEISTLTTIGNVKLDFQTVKRSVLMTLITVMLINLLHQLPLGKIVVVKSLQKRNVNLLAVKIYHVQDMNSDHWVMEHALFGMRLT